MGGKGGKGGGMFGGMQSSPAKVINPILIIIMVITPICLSTITTR